MLNLLWDFQLVKRPSFRISEFESSLSFSPLQILLKCAACLFLSWCYCILEMWRTDSTSNTVKRHTIFNNIWSLHVREFAVFPLLGSTSIPLSISRCIDYFLAFRIFLILLVLLIVQRLILNRFLINIHFLVFLMLIFLFMWGFKLFLISFELLIVLLHIYLR